MAIRVVDGVVDAGVVVVVCDRGVVINDQWWHSVAAPVINDQWFAIVAWRDNDCKEGIKDEKNE